VFGFLNKRLSKVYFIKGPTFCQERTNASGFFLGSFVFHDARCIL
jgi:hypothetical protein